MEPVPLSAVRSEPLKNLIKWYEQACDGDRWPSVAAFRITNLPAACWPHVARVDVSTNPFRVFYRAAGQYLCDARGFDFSQKYLDELPIPQRRDLEEWYRYALTIKEPFLSAGYQTVDSVRFYYESCCLPLGTKQDNPRAFILVEAAEDVDYWREAVRNRRYDFISELTSKVY